MPNIPFFDDDKHVRHDTLYEHSWTRGEERVRLPHRIIRIHHFTWPCDDTTVIFECSCGLQAQVVVSIDGGCGEVDHRAENVAYADEWHRQMVLFDSSQVIALDDDGVAAAARAGRFRS